MNKLSRNVHNSFFVAYCFLHYTKLGKYAISDAANGFLFDHKITHKRSKVWGL